MHMNILQLLGMSWVEFFNCQDRRTTQLPSFCENNPE